MYKRQVFWLLGSKMIELGFILICLNCSAVINLCSSLQMIIGLSAFSKFRILSIVTCRKEEFFSLSNDKYCLGKLLLESGQSLVPVPPHRIIGNNLLFFFKKIFCRVILHIILNKILYIKIV